MARITKPQEIFETITQDFKQVFADDLTAIILYGSGAGSDYKPGKSDLNFLIVISEEAIDHLDKAMETVSRWRKKNVATPLFMTQSYIESSLDSFPIEFINIKTNYVLVYGEDVLKDISFKPHDIRLQCEREIKAKIVLLREGFLETEGKTKRIKALIAASITAFISIFNGILYLKNTPIPSAKRDIINAVGHEIPINRDVFLKCLDIKEGTGDFSSSEISNIFGIYLMEVRRLWEFIDTMEM